MQLRKSLIYRKSVRMLTEQLKGKSSLTANSITKKGANSKVLIFLNVFFKS